MKPNYYRKTELGIEMLLAGNTDKCVLLDEVDFEKVKSFRWRPSFNATNPMVYAMCKGPTGTIYMHRIIADAPKGKVVDHINRNGLDNRRLNLRVVTMVENSVNTGGIARNSSKTGILGVSTHTTNSGLLLYVARVNKGKKSVVKYFPHTPQGLIQAEQTAKALRFQMHSV